MGRGICADGPSGATLIFLGTHATQLICPVDGDGPKQWEAQNLQNFRAHIEHRVLLASHFLQLEQTIQKIQ
jgi:hypothetical protein